jgi:hypothetical protein
MTNKMVFSNKNKTVLAGLILAFSASAQGATSWNFNDAGGWDSSQTYTSGTDSVTVASYVGRNVSSWWTSNDVNQGEVYSWSSGLGAKKVGESAFPWFLSPSSRHTMDNYNGEYEAILFDFGEDNLFAMNSVSVGWFESDSDLSVIALTDESLGGANLGNLKWSELLAKGWDDVAQLCDVGVGTASFNNDANPTNNVYARYWLVGAHNPVLHNVAMNCDMSSSSSSHTCSPNTSYWDGVKISGVSGSYRKPGGGQPVPEPATLLMMTLGLGFIGTRRKFFKA